MSFPSFGRTNTSLAVPLGHIDHAPLGALLAKYVDDRGRVAYAAWKAGPADVQTLHDYLGALSGADPDAPAARGAVLAFWVNAYNALTLAAVLHLYPTASVRDHAARAGGFNVWKDVTLRVGPRAYSLDDMEHGILRRLGEPRIHFALVCASNGCPILRREVYTAGGVDAELDANARAFFARPESLSADPAARVVSLSELFRWYGGDFAGTPAGRLAAVRRFFPATADWGWLDGADVRIEYLPYDWKLNDRPGGETADHSRATGPS
jgi:hypothetical protein